MSSRAMMARVRHLVQLQQGRKGVMMVLLNIVFVALISITIVGFMAWSICMQHRQSGGADLRIRRRLPRIIKLVSPDARELGRPATVAPKI